MKNMKFFSIVSLSLISFFIYSDNFSLVGKEYLSPFPSPYSLTFLEGNNLSIEWYDKDSEAFDWDYQESFEYLMTDDNGLLSIEIEGKISRSLEASIDKTENSYGNKIVFLAGQHTRLEKDYYTKKKYHPNVCVGYITKNNNTSLFLLDIPNYELLSRTYRDATSTLVEYGKEYSVENLKSLEAESSWVEGVDGYGIGESFIIENSWGENYPYIFIINGFISLKHPNLYKENGRIKKILVEDIVNNTSVTCDVLDTPNPQTVDISKLNSSEDLKITILEVFEGEKYQDTAIHYFITYNNEIIPYK